jgi:bacillithiol synthase
MFAEQRIPYNQTNAFSKIALDYLKGDEKLRPFYEASPTLNGIAETIKKKQLQPVDRKMLVQTLLEQYKIIQTTPEVTTNIHRLANENCFTVCTAHQPNLFTGPLYFIYKILHTIKLAEVLKKDLPGFDFVPVYYMGSEDADFAELNHTYVDGKKIEWKKEQKGAVGRMVVDKSLVQLIDELEGQLIGEQHGAEVIGLLRSCYSAGKDIQTATFELVNQLYGQYGLIVLIPDHPAYKAQMIALFDEELFQNTSAAIVQQTSKKLEEHYNVQAHPREINLFYLKGDIRERIIRKEEAFVIHNTSISFSTDEIRAELSNHPERFSPNVILRGLFQETILPNLVFIGGGGELAYWLQLKELFAHYKVVYPVLVLRNSFLVIEKKWKEKICKLDLAIPDIFKSANELMNLVVERMSANAVSLNGNFERAEAFYEEIKMQAAAIDPTLSKHVAAIKTRSLKYLQELEKKMLRAEKRKYADEERGIQNIKTALFPANGLQERKENFSGFYAKWGKAFIDELYRHSLALEQEFMVLTES